MSAVKTVTWVVIAGYALYHVVDDRTRLKFDNGVEAQNIILSEFKNHIYFGIQEFFGADEVELKAEKSKYENELRLRREALQQRKLAEDPSYKP